MIGDAGGYLLVDAAGEVFPFGDATWHGDLRGVHLDAPIVGIAGAPDVGYWLVGADGGVFAFGAVPYLGGMANVHLDAPIVAILNTGLGLSYDLEGADGGVFAFGTSSGVTEFFGSAAGEALNAPIVGASLSAVGLPCVGTGC
jgi:hypothetical protein